MLGDVKSLLPMPSNVLPLHLKQTFPPKIWIFIEGEGDGIKSRLSFKIFSTLIVSAGILGVFFAKKWTMNECYIGTFYVCTCQSAYHAIHAKVSCNITRTPQVRRNVWGRGDWSVVPSKFCYEHMLLYNDYNLFWISLSSKNCSFKIHTFSYSVPTKLFYIPAALRQDKKDCNHYIHACALFDTYRNKNYPCKWYISWLYNVYIHSKNTCYIRLTYIIYLIQ